MKNLNPYFFFGSLVFFLSCVSLSKSDIPVHCLYEQYLGHWTYFMGPGGNDNSINCSKPFEIVKTFSFDLLEPDVVHDSNGRKGFWTRIYDEGVEVVIGDQKFFAFSKYVADPRTGKAISFCNETFAGWYHNKDGSNWGCYYGSRSSLNKFDVQFALNLDINKEESYRNLPFVQDEGLIEAMNRDPNRSWKSVVYEQFEGRTIGEMQRLAGGKPFSFSAKEELARPLALRANSKDKNRNAISPSLPKEFDWRNINSVNYVSPVRNQGSCGSCYVFGTMAMLEARLRIMSNNTNNVILSPQEVVSCSEYSQGCDGGFPYLVEKYAEDFYLVEEDCFPYGSSSSCSSRCTNPSKKIRATNYHYLGGYYGACNEQLMMEEIYANGPIAVSFEVYDDFYNYQSGVYMHSSSAVRINPWQEVNHAVCIVGWGVDESNGKNLPYWIVKNSWGSSWGLNGYFLILRGSNECAIETMASGATPLMDR